MTTTGEDWHIDWATLASQLRPESIPTMPGRVIAANLQTQLGTEWGDYVVQLDADLDAFFGAGQKLPGNVSTLWAIELDWEATLPARIPRTSRHSGTSRC